MVERFVEHFTYLGLFFILFIGGLGVPIPEEAAILASGVLAHQRVIRWWLGLTVCVVGVLTGDITLYWIGHHWGTRVVRWWIVGRVLSPPRLEALLDAYRRHGVKIVFTTRHVLGLRAAAFLTAGIAHFPFWKFLVADASAVVIGVPLSFGIAFLFTDRLAALMAEAHRIEHWIALLALLSGVAWLATLAWRRRRRIP